MGDDDSPWVLPEEDVAELTVRVVVIGVLLGAVMTAANAYLGLYVGMTVSASIPAAVMSMLILRGFKFKDVTILENNSVQTMASAGESLAAGIIFTVPALLVLGIWTEIMWLETLIIAVLGGLLGTMFTIALRRLFIVEEALPYPEGVACREVLVAGEKGGTGLIAIMYALGIGAIYGWFVKGFRVTHQHVEGGIHFLGTRLYGGAELSLALLSVGFIVGLRIASFIFLGGVLGFGILVPLYGLINGWPGSGDIVDDFYLVWSSQIRYVGVGAMVVGGIYTLWTMKDTIFVGLSKALNTSRSDNSELLRTEKDLPLDKVMMFSGVLVVLTFLFYWYATGSLLLALAGALFLAVVSFFFAAVAGYIAGVVGSSNSPVSGMTIATLLFTIGLVWIVGDLMLGMQTRDLMIATMFIAAIVATSAAIAGDVMQDLKTGHMVGATPYRQQIAEIIGVLVGAIVIGPVLSLLHNAFQITKTACLATNQRILEGGDSGRFTSIEGSPNNSLYNCDDALLAPQAELIGAIVQGAFGGDLNLQMVILGAVIAVILIRLKMPVMSVAIGIYLPLALSVPIMLGGVISHILLNGAILRVDGTLEGEASSEAKKAVAEVQDRGVLIGAGFIAGESLMGVLLAIFIVADIDPAKALGIGTLGDSLSLLFYGWFVAVFITLAAQAMPKGSHLITDTTVIIAKAGKDLIKSLQPPSRK